MMDTAGESSQPKTTLKAYISKSLDREMNIFYIAAICDTDKDALLAELSGYNRDNLEKEVGEKYPGIDIENE